MKWHVISFSIFSSIGFFDGVKKTFLAKKEKPPNPDDSVDEEQVKRYVVTYHLLASHPRSLRAKCQNCLRKSWLLIFAVCFNQAKSKTISLSSANHRSSCSQMWRINSAARETLARSILVRPPATSWQELLNMVYITQRNTPLRLDLTFKNVIHVKMRLSLANLTLIPSKL